MTVSVLLMIAALGMGEPDGVVATAPATSVDLDATIQPLAPSTDGATQSAVPHGLSTDEQIDRWIAGRSADDKPYAETSGGALDAFEDDRKPHGEVSVSIGTGGYRDYAAAVSLPVGENGRLDISYRHVENGYGYRGYGYGHGYGGPYFDDSGYAFPGYRPGAAAEFEWRAQRPGGPPQRGFRSESQQTGPK